MDLFSSRKIIAVVCKEVIAGWEEFEHKRRRVTVSLESISSPFLVNFFLQVTVPGLQITHHNI